MREKMVKIMLAGAVAWAICGPWTKAAATEAPVLSRLSGAEKARVANLIAAAKKEGELVGYFAKLRPDVQEKVLSSFREQYGLSESDLKIKFVSTRTGSVVTKITEELRAKVYKTDIVNTAPAFWFDELIAKREIMPYDCPEYKHFSPLVADPKVGPANPPYYISAMISAFALSYNPNYVKRDIVHWKDVLRPEYEGKIICGDVSTSFSLIEAYLAIRKVVGKSFFEELGKLKPFLSMTQAEMAGKCTSGEFPVNVLSSQDIVFRTNEKGGGLRLVFPPEGWAIVGYPTAILARAPHPNAAKLFLDYLHGEHCQNLLLNLEGNVVGRLGVKSNHEVFPRSIGDLKGVIEMDWRKVTRQEREEAREESRKLLKERM